MMIGLLRSKTPHLGTDPKALGIEKGTGRQKVGDCTRRREIAQIKSKDLNVNSIEAAERIVEGAARGMGVGEKKKATVHHGKT
jgi:ribosomal protein L11